MRRRPTWRRVLGVVLVLVLAATAAACRRPGAQAMGIEVDVADRGSVDAAVEAARATLGPIGILVTSAGIESFTPLVDITPESWDRIIANYLEGEMSDLDDDAILLADRVLCHVDAVNDVSLVEYGRFARIQILRL